MTNAYDSHYQTEHLFGDAYPELIEFLREHPLRGKVLDLGCGQGRDALAIARLGYQVTGVDSSRVGIDQMNRAGQAEQLNLVGLVADLYLFDRFAEFDIILLDSMLHFAKKERTKEIALLRRIMTSMRAGSLLIICIQDIGKKVGILNQAMDCDVSWEPLVNQAFTYTFRDPASGHRSSTPYRMVIIKKS